MAVRARVRRYWFEHEGREIELGSGTVLMGRSSTCHIVVDDGLASRRHAKLEVTSDGVTVEDCDSVNGVFVNSRRITGALRVKDGDHVQIGRQEFVLKSALVSDAPERDRSLAETRLDTVRSLPAIVTESETTFSGDTLDLLGGVAEKILALGRGDEAERILSAPLQGLLGEMRGGRRPKNDAEMLEKAARYAVKLAAATSKGQWVDYVIDIYAIVRRPLPVSVIDPLYDTLRKTSAINLGALRAYLKGLRELGETLSPADRFALQRIEGLERLASSK
jgi:pSer/pThr/pTyr-binding forkhead associated (FHA) protein